MSNTALNASQPFTGVIPADHKNDLGVSLGGRVRIPKICNGHNRTDRKQVLPCAVAISAPSSPDAPATIEGLPSLCKRLHS